MGPAETSVCLVVIKFSVQQKFGCAGQGAPTPVVLCRREIAAIRTAGGPLDTGACSN